MKNENLNPKQIIDMLRQHQVKIWEAGGQLHYKVLDGDLSAHLRNIILQNKGALVRFLKHNKQGASVANGLLKASYVQKQLYFLDSLYEGSFHYNIPFLYKITGKLSGDIFQQALSIVVNRHDILRAHFIEKEHSIYQVLTDKVISACSIFDLSINVKDQESEARKIIQKTHYNQFNLNTEVLYKFAWIKLNEDVFYFCGVFHHSIIDGDSLDLWLNELFGACNLLLSNKKISAKKDPVQFCDYVRWQSNLMNSDLMQKQLSYWKENLKDMEPVLNLPFDLPRPSEHSYNGTGYRFIFSAATKPLVDDFIKAHSGISYFTLFLTAYFAFLKRYCQQKDFTVGIPVSNKRLESFQNVIGMFVNSLPIRHAFTPEETFLSLLRSIQEAMFSAYENQDVPLEKIIEEVGIKRDPAYSPVFQTMLYMSENNDFFEYPGFKVEAAPYDFNISKFDISLAVLVKNEQIVVEFEYSTDLFLEATIKRMAKHFENLLCAMLKNPYEQVSKLDLLTIEERKFFIEELNDNTAAFNREMQIQQIFEQCAEKYPSSIAVQTKESCWSYQKLNERTNQIAHFLIKEGVLPDQCVGVMMERSNEVLAVLLGILKSGAAFVPMDPEYPCARLQYIKEDAHICVLFTQKSLVNKLDFKVDKIISIDECISAFDGFSKTNPPVIASMNHLAYVIYTSGSTGHPKGVMIPHLGITHYIQWANRYYDSAKGSGAPVHTSLAFDLTMTSLFCPICCGKTVFMMPDELGFEGIMQALRDRQDYSLIKITPAHLKLIQNNVSITVLEKLFATIVIGGEALYYDALSFWHKSSKRLRFINEYGATETSVADTIYELPAAPLLGNSISLPVGKAIANSQMLVLDEHLNPVPIGVIGEIYLGGIGLARGYLNRSDLTDAKFISNPFKCFVYDKIYKTGDLGRVFVDGNVEFMGRIDNQVKIKGFRVELSEIQAVIKKQNFVKDVVVTTRVDKNGDRYVVAYLLFEKCVELNALREQLRQLLPTYMVPSVFIPIHEIPLTVNGKVDDAALPDPQQNFTQLQAQYEALESPIEKKLGVIWSSVLGIEKIGRNDNFFALGGDSIMTLQVIAKAREVKLNINTRQLLMNQTIAELTKIISESTISSQSMNKLNAEGKVNFTPIQKWFFNRKFSDINYFNQAFLFKVKLWVSIDDLRSAIEILVNKHSSLRLRFACSSLGGWEQYYSDDVASCFRISCRKIIKDSMLSEIVSSVHTSLNITNGPILHCALIDGYSDGCQRMLIVFHHLVIDGISWRIFLEDLMNILDRKDILPPTDNYKTWAAELEAYRAKNDFAKEREYWLKNNFSLGYNFPLQKEKDSNKLLWKGGRKKAFSLSKLKTNALLTIPYQQYQIRINEVLLIALLLAIKKIYNQNGLLLAMESHGRESCVEGVDVSRTIGWFTSYYPLLLALPLSFRDKAANCFSGNDYKELLKHLKEQIRRVPDNGLAYGLLQYGHEEDGRDLINIDAIHMAFNYLGQFDQSISAHFEEDTTEVGQCICKNNAMIAPLSINSWVNEKRLMFEVIYSSEVISSQAVSLYFDAFFLEVDALLLCCETSHERVYTPSDFQLPTISQKEIDLLCCDTEIELINYVSPYQEDMILHTIKHSDSDAYLTHIVWKIGKEIDAKQFKLAWEMLAKKYSVFRATFFSGASLCYQVIEKNAHLDWHDFRVGSFDLQNFLNEDRKRGFDIFNRNPMRFHFIQTDDQVVFVWAHHHILLDGWSLSILLNDLNLFYKGKKDFQCDIHSRDLFQEYTRWQKNKNTQDAEAFWRNEFARLTTPTLLTQNPEVDLHGKNREMSLLSITLMEDEKNKIDKFMRTNGYPVNCLFQLAWARTLSVYVGASTVAFASMNAGRNSEFIGFEKIVGLCANVLPFCLSFSTDDSTEHLLSVIQDKNQKLLCFSYYSSVYKLFEKYKNNTGALFDTFFIYENYPINSDGSNLMPMQELQFFVKMNFPMMVVVIPEKEKYTLNFVYDVALFSEARVKDIAHDFILQQELIMANAPVEGACLKQGKTKMTRLAKGKNELIQERAA